VIARRADPHQEAAVRSHHEEVVLAFGQRAIEDLSVRRETAAIESPIDIDASDRRDVELAPIPVEAERVVEPRNNLLRWSAGFGDHIHAILCVSFQPSGRQPQPTGRIEGECGEGWRTLRVHRGSQARRPVQAGAQGNEPQRRVALAGNALDGGAFAGRALPG
jgi:hypothetical protein